MKRIRLQATLIIPIVLIVSSCSEIRTNDPIESYKYWAGADPTDDIRLLKGKYWQSSHWTKEYILYLKFKPTEAWWAEFVNINHLEETREKWDKPSDSPDWFQPNYNFKIFKSSNDIYVSRYFRNKATGECYIYEMQL